MTLVHTILSTNYEALHYIFFFAVHFLWFLLYCFGTELNYHFELNVGRPVNRVDGGIIFKIWNCGKLL